MSSLNIPIWRSCVSWVGLSLWLLLAVNISFLPWLEVESLTPDFLPTPEKTTRPHASQPSPPMSVPVSGTDLKMIFVENTETPLKES